MRTLLSVSVFFLHFYFATGQSQLANTSDLENLPVLMIFSGSDWCLPCIRLEREVFSNSKFLEFSQNRFSIMKIDFPQKTKLHDTIIERNESLAEKYNSRGYFPYVVLVDSEGNKIAHLETEGLTLENAIQDLSNLLTGQSQIFRKQTLQMGSAFEFVIVSNNPGSAQQFLQFAEAEVERLNDALSEWDENSDVSELNRMAGIEPVALNKDAYGLLERSLQLSYLTDAAYDVTFKGLDYYSFDKDTLTRFPDTTGLHKRLKLIDYQKIKLQPNNVAFLQDTGMAIGFGAAGKGYAADKVKLLWEEFGVKSGVINASGDLTAWGTRPDGSPWKVGIASPENPDEILLWIPIKNKAVATSGSYEKYFVYNGTRYSHILNPQTGLPISDKKSTTVISPSAELSDALATALFVLPIQEGLDLIRQLPETECLIIDVNNELHFSDKLKLVE